MNKGGRWFLAIAGLTYWVLLLLGLVISVFPIYWMIRSSLIDNVTFQKVPIVWLPVPLTLESYRMIWERFNLFRVIGNTLAIAVVTMVGNVIIDAMAGYGLARTEFFGKNIIFAMYLATMMIGIEVLMVPQFLIVRYLGLYDSFPAIVLPGLASPFSIFLMRQFFLNFPREIEESAFVDGASRFRIFCSIALPTAKPVLATVAVIHFLAGWESFIWPLIVTSTAGRWAVMQVVIARATQKISAFIPAEAGINYPMVMAASFISAIPMLFVFLFAQRFFIHGLSAGALKG